MKKLQLNIFKLIINTKNWKNKSLHKIIFKYFKKTTKLSNFQKFLIKLYKWKQNKKYSLSSQVNVCKKTGSLKKTFNVVSFNRHSLRSMLNTSKIPHFKKLSW